MRDYAGKTARPRWTSALSGASASGAFSGSAQMRRETIARRRWQRLGRPAEAAEQGNGLA
jgi:hypothetical protein